MRRFGWSSLVVVATCLVASCSDRRDRGDETEDSVADDLGGSQAQDEPAEAGMPASAGGSAQGGSSASAAAGSVSAGDAPVTPMTAGASGATSGSSSGGTANQAGNVNTAGAANSAGEGGAVNAQGGNGDGGAGAPTVSAGRQCTDCAASTCGPTIASCKGNSECAPWLACLSSCDSAECVNACDADYLDVARVYYGVYACLAGTCADECAVAQPNTKKCTDANRRPAITSAPGTLAETGLYSSGLTPASDVSAYEVKYPLWSDGATKERYIYIPRCATIDTSDMEHWQFPVGTRLWKNFSVDGQRVETRFIHRYGTGDADWLYATYGWDSAKQSDPSAATVVLHGMPNAGGTTHDIPDPWECTACHGKLPDKPLGFSAIQLTHSGNGLTMKKLSELGWLSSPAPQGFTVPGTPVQQAALGYLHGNCGGCHNSAGEIPRDNPMKLRLLVAQTDYAKTDAVLTTIGVPTLNEDPDLHGKPRIAPQDPEGSAIFLRMSDRDSYPMPPIATQVADTNGGVAAVKAWIESLPKP